MGTLSHYTSSSITAVAHSILMGFGCHQNEADIIAEHLTDANLTGHDSHGIGMLPMYGDQVRDGNLIPNQTPDYHAPTGAISIVDARLGFGHRMALLGLDHAMKTLPEHKVAILGLRNSGHVSRVGTYSEYCAARGYVSIHMVNVVGHPPLVAPHGASDGGFSTNPISMAMPVDGQAQPMLDMATSTVAFGKVRVASNKGEKMPPGCLVDKDGLPTTDPNPMAERHDGALSAFGKHKGSGLGIFVELMAGALASTDTVATKENLPHGVINNMLSIIIDPEAFDSQSDVSRRTMEFYDFIKSRPKATDTDEILMPGEPEINNRARRQANGIPVDQETIHQLIETGAKFNLDKDKLSGLLDQVS